MDEIIKNLMMGIFLAILGNAGTVRPENKSVNVYDVQKVLAFHVLK